MASRLLRARSKENVGIEACLRGLGPWSWKLEAPKCPNMFSQGFVLEFGHMLMAGFHTMFRGWKCEMQPKSTRGFSKLLFSHKKSKFVRHQFFPTCRVRASRFYQSHFLLLVLLLLFLLLVLRDPDRSGHCLNSYRSQWAVPDINREL